MGCLHQHYSRLAGSYRLDKNGILLKFLRVLLTLMYFKDRNWISKTVNCISCSVVCKIVFCSEFPDIPDNAGKVTRRRRRRTQATAKRYAFHPNAVKDTKMTPITSFCCLYCWLFSYTDFIHSLVSIVDLNK